ncbi:sugar transferase [Vibrio anguillarum]|uniref:Sugar transferase n=16 Tax=Vibrio anguillarum TaxID=55601 RepID=A0AAW4AFQ6_VIBAN|nr:Undecaprenyl-phosphate beta-N-acetyl-D-fucosaminephosphotransferase [Vibrio anguillarum 775]AGU56645.1 UDP-N-acetylgalactosaminyltransferase [Vibrio anguillarum M3]ASF93018.1 sugar transferase [Vibrio anguillarum]ATA48387.1 sugar transferase [Vibrio anguillarum]AXN06247.1 sugar transferase [Vibrio anguillarum]
MLTYTIKSREPLMLRILDFVFALLGLCILWPILLIVYVLGYFDTGSPVFMQTRVGRHKKPFTLIKFRTMPVDTQSVATHLVGASSVTKLGSILRKTKLDELPQLINVVKGEMSLVGPRPCLFNQQELIQIRDEKEVFDVRPGITGLAQVNEIDMSTPELLADWDLKMIQNMSLTLYFTCIIQTVLGKGAGDRV